MEKKVLQGVERGETTLGYGRDTAEFFSEDCSSGWGWVRGWEAKKKKLLRKKQTGQKVQKNVGTHTWI